MKRAILFTLLIVAVVLPIVAKDSDADIKAVVDQFAAAWGSLDPSKAAPFYAKDANLVFYDVLPLKYTGWDEYDKGVRPHFAQFQSLKITPKGDLQVTRRGDVAWTTQTVGMDVTVKEGEGMALDMRQTLILEKRGGKWLIVHEHLSAPLQMHEHEHEHAHD
jgi:uncharacterized protein (TIGR02246 family)